MVQLQEAVEDAAPNEADTLKTYQIPIRVAVVWLYGFNNDNSNFKNGIISQLRKFVNVYFSLK